MPARWWFPVRPDVLTGWQQRGATGQHSKASRTTSHPGVYQRGSRWVAVYRQDGRQRKEFAASFREAREIKIRRAAEEASGRAGPKLHSYALEWVDHYAGRGANDVTRGC
jgi:hypothetical protein